MLKHLHLTIVLSVLIVILVALYVYFTLKASPNAESAVREPSQEQGIDSPDYVNYKNRICKEMGQTAEFYRKDGQWVFSDCFSTPGQEEQERKREIID